MRRRVVANRPPALGRVARIIGWLCVAGRTIQIVGVLHLRALMAADMQHAIERDPTVALPLDSIYCPGPIEMAGDVLSMFWLPYAVWCAFCAARARVHLTTQERLLLILVPLLFALIQFLERSRSLYGYPLYGDDPPANGVTRGPVSDDYPDMKSKAFERYLELDAALEACRAGDAGDEASLLATMSTVWEQLTTAEQEWLEYHTFLKSAARQYGDNVPRLLARLWPDAGSRERAQAVLAQYGGLGHEREPERVHLAALKLSVGSLERLANLIEEAKRGYPEVVLRAEHPAECAAEARSNAGQADDTDSDRATRRAQDMQQYWEWLRG
jgi:hypothetical protein